ncbi:hypothetical protein RWH43_13310 [Microbacterium sp. KSW2-21]|uniref:Lipoprotein n=1 Tax=Microbacterium algihabitans TaxID=3075992 RepID=A0ABU3RXX9_9MICO|nr:hypothetical protein [Microbacterium sp. KSW2-21]MDU0327737.1 hypothetical protein [Microbacterium sp. KSW2-21]
MTRPPRRTAAITPAVVAAVGGVGRRSRMPRRHRPATAVALAVLAVVGVTACTPAQPDRPQTGYPWHTDIVSTTFWVGEVFDPNASDGSQRISTYDSDWLGSYGGCDGVVDGDSCRTEARTAADDYFPTRMTPRENPFYLDLPFDDVNDDEGFATRGEVVPWADSGPYAAIADDPTQSLMKNRWVVLRKGDRTCYGQIEDAGPGEYRDAAYVFGADDRRPANARYNGAGLDVSPALNGCLGFAELDGDDDTVDWAFVDDADVPDGPWTRIVTDSPVR